MVQVDDAEKMKEADEKARSGVQAKNDAENLSCAITIEVI